MFSSRTAPWILSLLSLLLIVGSVAAQGVTDQVGNLSNPASSVPGLFHGDQMFAYLIDPDMETACQTDGFKLEAVHMYLDFSPSQVPVTFQIAGGLTAAVPDPSGQEFVPGEDLCVSPVQTVTITTPGLHVVTVAMDQTCGCMPIDQAYFLTLMFFGPVEGQLVIDDIPEPGVVFWNNGAGWEDMFGVDKTSGGKVIIWGDIVCCTTAIGTDSNTWGQVKTLFR